MVHVSGHKRVIKRTLKGRFIRERVASPRKFDPRSFRAKKVGKHRVITACPKGFFHRGRCNVGLHTQAVLHPKAELGKKFSKRGKRISRMRGK